MLMNNCMEEMVTGSPMPDAKLCYETNFACIERYLESRLDIMQHKFLVFVFNVNDNHWVTVVVVNAYLVFDRYLNDNQDITVNDGGVGEDELPGWCVMDSLGGVNGVNGFKPTIHKKLKKEYGVRLFLNMCASILKNRKKRKGLPSTRDEIDCDQPFGSWDDCNGTVDFPRLDFTCDSIIKQSNASDCGLAAVANSMAFVKHLRNVKFFNQSDFHVILTGKRTSRMTCLLLV
jgi:hypothetical protein